MVWVITYAAVIVSALIIPKHHFWVFVAAFAFLVYATSHTIWFAPAMFGLATSVVIHNIILQRAEVPDDDCATFKWKDVTSHCTCTLSFIMAAYVSMFQL